MLEEQREQALGARAGVGHRRLRSLATAEIRLVQSASLARGKTRLTQDLDDPLGENPLFRWNRGRVSLPTKLRPNVLVQASLRASDLICTAVQVAYLVEEGFELSLVERAHSFKYERRPVWPHDQDDPHSPSRSRSTPILPRGKRGKRGRQEPARQLAVRTRLVRSFRVRGSGDQPDLAGESRSHLAFWGGNWHTRSTAGRGGECWGASAFCWPGRSSWFMTSTSAPGLAPVSRSSSYEPLPLAQRLVCHARGLPGRA
jgi:hypothetical protein